MSRVIDYIAVAIVIMTPALGGARDPEVQGFILLLCCSLVLFCPSKCRLPKMILSVLAALLALGSIGFLPESWIGELAWKTTLKSEFDIHLAQTYSPHPWGSFEEFTILLGGILWWIWMANRRWEVDKSRLIAIYTLGIAALALVALQDYFGGYSPPHWSSHNATVGPFPNRNHSANVFAVAGVMALGLLAHRAIRREPGALGWGIVYLILGVALVFNMSRGGLMVYLVGSSGLFLCLALQRGRRQARLWTTGSAVALLMAIFALLFGAKTLDRFKPVESIGGAGRMEIYADTLPLIRDVRWKGAGLGTFTEIFAQYRHASADETQILHPESDWLLLAVELGWFAPVLLAFAIGYWLKQNWPTKRVEGFALNCAAVISLIAFCLHGIVDVSGHQMGAIWPVLFLSAIIQRPTSQHTEGVALSRLPRALAVPLIGISLCMFVPALSNRLLPNSDHIRQWKSEIRRAMNDKDFERMLESSERAIAQDPIDYFLYYYRGVAKVRLDLNRSSAINDFRIAYYLDPNDPNLPYYEGLLWLEKDPQLTLEAWKMALESRALANRPALFTKMLLNATNKPDIRDSLWEFAKDKSDLTITYLGESDQDEFDAAMAWLIEIDPRLQRFDLTQKQQVIGLWTDYGDLETLVQSFKANQDWLEFGWTHLARIYAHRQDYKAACALVETHAPAPNLPTLSDGRSLMQLSAAVLRDPSDFAAGLAYYLKLNDASKTDEALALLDRIIAQPKCPKYFNQLQFQILNTNQKYQLAWQAWK